MHLVLVPGPAWPRGPRVASNVVSHGLGPTLSQRASDWVGAANQSPHKPT